MKILGLKLSRYRQWREVLREELRVIGWKQRFQLAIDLIGHSLHLRRHKRMRFRRMRKCYRCPVFDKDLRRCRPFTGSPLGCGCWVPLSALCKDHGWLTDAGIDKDGLCW